MVIDRALFACMAGRLPFCPMGADRFRIRRLMRIARWSSWETVTHLVWVTIGNDDQAVFVFTPQSRSAVFALRSYAVILMDTRIEKYDHDPARLYRNLDVLTGDTRLTLVAFDTAYGQALKTQYPIMFIPTFENPISWMDRHANEKGNQEIAASMLPIVKRVIQRGCS